jgi:hypothetical protein
MRRKGGDPSALGQVAEAVVDRLFGEPPGLHMPMAVDRQQQRPGGLAAHPQPGVQRVPRPVADEHSAFLVALPDEMNPARLAVVVDEIERDQLGAPEPPA